MKKILFVGLGSIGQRHLKNLISIGEFELYAFRKRNNPLPQEFGDLKINVLVDWEEVKSIRPEICILASPPIVQQEMLPMIVDLGMDFFIEKPIGLDLHLLESMIPVIREKGLVSMVGYNLRYHPIVSRIKNILEEGGLGNITSFRLEVGQYLPDWHSNEDYRSGYSANKSLGGGVTLDLIHEIDLAYFLFGEFVEVHGMQSKQSHLEIDVEDTSEIVVRTKMGYIGSIHLDYINRFGSRQGTIHGDKGYLKYDLISSSIELNIKGDELKNYTFDFKRNQMYRDELIAFMNAVLDRTNLTMNFEKGLKVLSYAILAKKNIYKIL
jgi:predicted dehydrogenase